MHYSRVRSRTRHEKSKRNEEKNVWASRKRIKRTQTILCLTSECAKQRQTWSEIWWRRVNRPRNKKAHSAHRYRSNQQRIVRLLELSVCCEVNSYNIQEFHCVINILKDNHSLWIIVILFSISVWDNIVARNDFVWFGYAFRITCIRPNICDLFENISEWRFRNLALAWR